MKLVEGEFQGQGLPTMEDGEGRLYCLELAN